MDSINFSASELCRALVRDLNESDGAELVTGVSAGKGTPTLSECGTDLIRNPIGVGWGMSHVAGVAPTTPTPARPSQTTTRPTTVLLIFLLSEV